MLNFFSNEILWGVSTWRFIMAVFIIFLGFGSRRVILSLFKGFLSKQVARTRAEWDDEMVELMPRPISVLIQILLWYLAAWFFQFPQEPIDTRHIIYQGLQVAIAIAAIWTLNSLVDVLAGALARVSAKTESKLDDQLIPLLRKTLKVIITITIGIMIIQNMGYSVTSMIAGLGVGGLALALAAKDTIANLFGSVIVFTDRPFQIGDWVEFSGIEGTVEEIGFRTTRIRRFDKSQVTVPNMVFSSTSIINHSRRNMRRITMTIGVTYETNSRLIKQLLDELRQLVQSNNDLDQGFNFVHFTEFGNSSLNIQIYGFTKTTVWTEWLAIREQLMVDIMDIVEKLGLEFAFPTHTVYLRDEQWPNVKKD